MRNMHPEVILALEHFNAINAEPHRWASLEIAFTNGDPLVRLELGAKYPGGFKERAIATRTYFSWKGQAGYTSQAHA